MHNYSINKAAMGNEGNSEMLIFSPFVFAVLLSDVCPFVTDGQTDAGQSDPYVPLYFAGNTINCLLSHHASMSQALHVYMP